MFKKSREKKRSLQGIWVQKHKIRLKLDAYNSKITSEWDKRISQLAQATWKYLGEFCTKLNLIPLQTNSNDHWVLCSRWKLRIHYALVAYFLAVVARQFIISILCLAVGGYHPTSMICLGVFVFSYVSFAGGIASSYTPTEMMALLNSWDPNVSWLQEEGWNELSVFGGTSDNIKVILTALLFHGISSDIAVTSIFITDIPLTVCGFVRSLNFELSSSSSATATLPPIIWRIMCFPFELIMALGPACVAAFNTCCGVLSLRLLRVYCNEMR